MKFVKFIASVLAIAAIVGGVLYATVFDVWVVPLDDPYLGVSVEPTLSTGDILVVSRHGTAERGQLARCPDPRQPGRFVIGRLMGKPQEKVTIQNEQVQVDGKRTPSPRACDPPKRTLVNPSTDEQAELTCSIEEISQAEYGALRSATRMESTSNYVVEATKVFLVSDNRHIHDDSRDYGQMDPSSCRHVLFRLWGTTGFGDSKRRFTLIW